MKNKFIACLLAVLMAFTAVLPSSFGAEETPDSTLRGMEYFIKRICLFTHEDRANLETIFVPLLITDVGLDTLKRTISEYTPESESIFHEMLRKLLVRVDKEDLNDSLSYLYMIDEKVREDYIGGFYKREEFALSQNGSAAMDAITEKVFKQYPDLRKVCEEDSITAKVAARVLQMFAAINNGKYLFYENEDSTISVGEIDESLKQKIEIILLKEELPFSSAEGFLKNACDSINASFAGEDIKSFIVVGNEIGLVKKYSATGAGGGNSGSGSNAADGRFGVSVAGDGDIVVYLTKGNQNIYEGTFDRFKVAFDFDSEGYLKDSDGKTVRYFAREAAKCYALLTRLGTYKFVKSQDSYFSDVNGWGREYINALYEAEIISGKGNGIFCPDDNITREEFVKLIVEMFGLKGDYGISFSDVLRDDWHYEYISAAKLFGIVDGFSDGSFGVGQNITRQDMCKILYAVTSKMKVNLGTAENIEEFLDRTEIAEYAYESVMALRVHGIISGDDKGCFNPSDFATRQEAAKMIYNVLKCYVKN